MRTGRAATGARRGVRADAQRNRDRLVEAARRAFATGNGKVTLDAVAREAGVGIGTLYRHFPTREDLVEAVYRAQLDSVCASAATLLESTPADQALRAWMDRFADHVAAKREMADTLRAVIASGAVTVGHARERMSAAVRLLLDAGSADGTLRRDVRAEDVVAALVGVFLACGGPGGHEQAARLMDLLLDALRPAPGTRPGH